MNEVTTTDTEKTAVFQLEAAREALERLEAIRERIFDAFETLRADIPLAGTTQTYKGLGPDFTAPLDRAIDNFSYNQSLFVWHQANPKALREEDNVSGRKNSPEKLKHFLQFCFADCCGHILSPTIMPFDDEINAQAVEDSFARAVILKTGINEIARNYQIITAPFLKDHPVLKKALEDFRRAAFDMKEPIAALGKSLGLSDEVIALKADRIKVAKLEESDTIGYLKPIDARMWALMGPKLV